MVKHLTFGVLSAAILAGCGGSSGGSSNANSFGTSYSISDYTAIESTSLDGTWVGVTNYTETYEWDDGVVDTDAYSKRQIFIIKAVDGEDNTYLQTQCESSSNKFVTTLNSQGTKVELEVNDYYNVNVTISDLNKMSGSTSSGSQQWNFVKISNDTSSLGNISVSRDGREESYTALALCESSLNGKDNQGYFWSYLTDKLGFSADIESSSSPTSSQYATVTRDLNFREDRSLHIFDLGNSFSSNNEDGNSTTISVSQSNTSSYVAQFTGTSDNGNATINANLNF